MTRSARCGMCDGRVVYNPETFAWRHDSRPADGDDHAPVPVDVAYPTKSIISKPKRSRNA